MKDLTKAVLDQIVDKHYSIIIDDHEIRSTLKDIFDYIFGKLDFVPSRDTMVGIFYSQFILYYDVTVQEIADIVDKNLE